MKKIIVKDLADNILEVHVFSGDLSGIEARAESMRTPDNVVAIEDVLVIEE